MSNSKIVDRLTDHIVNREPLTTSGQRVLRPRDRRGFFVLIGRESKTFTVQTEKVMLGRRQVHRKALGRFPEMDCRAAYAAADIELGQVRGGAKAPGAPNRGPTLREAWHLYRDRHLRRLERSERTVQQYEDCLERTLADWLDTPLRELAENPELVAQRHTRIGEKGEVDSETGEERGGKYQANHCMRSLRAVYRFARKTHKALPVEHPCTGVVYYPEEQRACALIDAKALRAWFSTWATIQNPVRRELHLLTLLTGSRADALCSARWADIKAARRALHQPLPKGGKKRAFDIPMSRAIAASLHRLRAYCRVAFDGSPWLFPSETSASGHTETINEKHQDDFATGHALRHTWITHAQLIGVSEFYQRLMTNHGKKRDVHQGYMSPAAFRRKLREAQEQISTHLLGHASEEVRAVLERPVRTAPRSAQLRVRDAGHARL
jgi:hypothetical protein